MELKIGKMTNADIAAWMGISEKSFKNQKQERLNQLEHYANFHTEAGKIIIDEVLDPVYNKKAGSPLYNRVQELTEKTWSKNGLDMCSRVAEEIFPVVQEENLTDSFPTTYSYTVKSKNELWGSATKKTRGSKVMCEYRWSKLNKDGKPVPLTKKEMETFHNVANKVFGNLEDKTLFVLDLMNKGQIKKEEVGEKLEELTQAQSNYPKFLKMAEHELGFKVYRGTQISRDAF